MRVITIIMIILIMLIALFSFNVQFYPELRRSIAETLLESFSGEDSETSNSEDGEGGQKDGR